MDLIYSSFQPISILINLIIGSTDQLVMICLDLMAAGSETTSTTLGWIGTRGKQKNMAGQGKQPLFMMRICECF